MKQGIDESYILFLEYSDMASFNLYTFQFEPADGALMYNLFEPEKDPREEVMRVKNNALREIIVDPNPFMYRNKSYKKEILFEKDDFIVLRIAGQRSIKLERNFKEERTINEPSVVVIIDNRKESQRMAIEDDTTAFASTDALSHIIVKNVYGPLLKKNLKFSLLKEYQPSEFWDYINKNPQKIQMVRFDFKYPNLGRSSDVVKEILGDSSKKIGSGNTKIEYNAQSGSHLILNKDDEFISGMADDSAKSGQPITLKISGIKKHVVTGTTKRTVQFDEASIQSDSVDDIKKIFDELLK